MYLIYFVIFYCIFRFCTSQLIYKPVSINKNILVPHVVNGRPAKVGDAPYQVSFKERFSVETTEYITFCGGVLIAPQSILTAAHCFESNSLLDRIFDCNCLGNSRSILKKKLRNKFAVAGSILDKALHPLKWLQLVKAIQNMNMSIDLRNTLMKYTHGQWRSLSKGVYPNKYNFPNFDIAVITTNGAFAYTDHVKPIPVASVHTEYSMKCLVSGYGRTSHLSGTPSRLLLADLEIIPTSYCSKMHMRNMYHFICTSTKIYDTAKGDSGGPLVCKETGDPQDNGTGVLVGIVSGHLEGAGSFFTRVSSYTDFITRYNATSGGKSFMNEFMKVGATLVCKGTSDLQDNGTGVLVGIVSGHLVGAGSFFTRVSSYTDFITRYNATSGGKSFVNEYTKVYAVFAICCVLLILNLF